LIHHLQRFHLLLFFFFGGYLEFWKRLVGLRYVLLRKPYYHRASYELLGALITIQFFILFCQAVKALLFVPRGDSLQDPYQIIDETQNLRNTTDEEKLMPPSDILQTDPTLARMRDQKYAPSQPSRVVEEEEEKNRCSLCMSPRRNPTVTDCGHLFCWNCITTALNTKEECPLCRTPCLSTKLLPLAHYG